MGLRLALFVAFGAVLGFGYHRLVGCRSGACAITANPYISTAYGALMGYLFSGGLR
ncbi:MAG: YtxH domain-containing protein [Myxococcales bacterium]|nr:YtxH domain-containing protein [Myxococcales bacterium]